MKKALVYGAGGFIGSHMVKHLKSLGYFVRGVDLKLPEFNESCADQMILGDLRDISFVRDTLLFKGENINFFEKVPQSNMDLFDEIYQFAADMGGAGYIFTGENDADIMHNSATINLNVLECMRELNETFNLNKSKVFYSGSACMYPEHNQLDPDTPDCREDSAYPANPDSEYGWEKLFSERLFLSYNRNYGILVCVSRYHNIFGPEGTWEGGKEKAPAAICRKVALLPDEGGEIEVWGDGKQTRSFLFIEECIDATYRLMQSNFPGPVNIGSEEMVTINELVDKAQKASGKKIVRKHKLDAPTGVRGRNSNNDLIRKELNWDYSQSLEDGIKKTYDWIEKQIKSRNK